MYLVLKVGDLLLAAEKGSETSNLAISERVVNGDNSLCFVRSRTSPAPRFMSLRSRTLWFLGLNTINLEHQIGRT
jgi:hypothetical protein